MRGHAGTWNLNRLLPKGMHFFIKYSSISGGIGATAAANYAAGCAYQDALGQYRNAIGERATTLNLGVMLKDGILSDNSTVRNTLMNTGYLLRITEKDMFALLEYHCDPAREIPALPLRSQVMVGLDVPERLVTRGNEIPIMMKRPLFGGTWNIADGAAPTASNHEDGATDISHQSATAQCMRVAVDTIADCLMPRLSKGLGVPLNSFDPLKPMNGYGVDSLVAVELRNWFQSNLNADVPVFEVMGNKSFAEVARLVAAKSAVVAATLSKR